MRIDQNSLRKNQEIYNFENGDKLLYQNHGIFMTFQGSRRVISTSVLNGGIRDDLEGVFNYNCLGERYECTLTEDTYELELLQNAKELGFVSDKVTGLSTAAWVDFVSVKAEEFMGLKVTAIVTGGIDKNAVRVGDPASYYEKNGVFHSIEEKEPPSHGTINIILYINKKLSHGVLSRALVTCTEAKVAAVEEMMIGSLYSHGLATGSGTDGTIVISDLTSDEMLTDASEHGKLGEMIGRTVMDAVKEALSLQTGACGPRQHTITERGRRYQITLGSLWKCYLLNQEQLTRMGKKQIKDICEFENRFVYFETNSNAVVWLSLYLYLLDQYRYGMLKWGEVVRETKQLTKSMLRLEKEEQDKWLFTLNDENDLLMELIEQAKRSILLLL